MSKVILVTGANRGIGFCIAQSLAQRSPDSYTILLASRDISSAENAIANILDTKVTLQPIALDVTSDDSIRACLDNVKERYGRLDGKLPSHHQQSQEHH
jgi:NAD(P)-dependent dehydrogenase (short-subunit alcohol dehydrogenase family)